VRNVGIGRARLFVGSFLLLAALITWGMTLLMSPHGSVTADGVEHVRSTIVTFIRNSAIGTLVLSTIAAWMLFPTRRPKKPLRDYALLATLVILVLTSVYQLVWLRTVVSN
jgi:hypothetical protein